MSHRRPVATIDTRRHRRADAPPPSLPPVAQRPRAVLADQVRSLILAGDDRRAQDLLATFAELDAEPRARETAPVTCRWRTAPLGARTHGHLWTSRQLELLALLPSHLSYREIAHELHISPNTVKTGLKVIYRVLGARSRREALDLAQQAGILSAPCAGPPVRDLLHFPRPPHS